jgi:hypothetical protein
VTFDENEDYQAANQVYSLLLGDAIPQALRGTNDSTFYTHYSQLSTVQANWGLYNLGRQDTNKSVSNVFGFTANATNYTNVDITNYPLNNISEGGYYNNQTLLQSPIPSPNISAVGAGGSILPILTKPQTTTQASRARHITNASIVIALAFAIAGTCYLHKW